MFRILLRLGIAYTFPIINVYAQPSEDGNDLVKLAIPEEAQEREADYRQSGGILTKRDYYLDDQLVGERRFYENGKVAEEKIYRDGKLHGYWRQYYESGQLFAERPYREGKPDGIFRFYDERGKLLGESTVKDGTGTLREFPYLRLGSYDEEIPYVNGKIHGTKRTWGEYSRYQRNGREESVVEGVSITEYQEGELIGWSATYDTLGGLISSGYYMKPRTAHGVFRRYDAEGRMVKGTPIYFVHGQRSPLEKYMEAAKKDPMLKISLDKDRPDETPDLKRPE